jgi:excinuclease UvrABC ATPase subunit
MKNEFTPINSGHLDGARYDSFARKLHVRFKNGSIYTVHDVSEQDAQDFFGADSQGEHFHQVFKPTYRIEKSK